jgi:hypothetical protein
MRPGAHRAATALSATATSMGKDDPIPVMASLALGPYCVVAERCAVLHREDGDRATKKRQRQVRQLPSIVVASRRAPVAEEW